MRARAYGTWEADPVRKRRRLGYALLALAVLLVGWGLFRQVDPIEFP